MKKKLLTIGHSYVVALNRSLMRELQSRGTFDVTVLAPEFFHGDLRSLAMEPEPVGSPLRVEPIPVYLSQKIHFFFYDPRALKKYLSTIDFDYFYLWEEPYIVSGFQVARLLKKMERPFAVFSAQNIAKKFPWPFSMFEKKVIEASESVWPCGRLVDEVLVKKGWAGHSRAVTPLPVDLQKFKSFSAEDKLRARKNLGLNAKLVVGFMGRFTAEKGCEVFIQTLAGLPKDLDWQGLMLGSGPLESFIRSELRRHGFENRVKVLAVSHDEVAKLLPLMDVLLAPSQPTTFWLEQFGRMLIESFACGVPVIASNSGEIPFVVAEAGLIVDPKNVEAWVSATELLLRNDQLRHGLAAKGSARAQLYSATALAPLVERNILAALSNLK